MSLSLVFTEICFSFSSFLSYNKPLSFLNLMFYLFITFLAPQKAFPQKKKYIYMCVCVCVCVHAHVCVFPPRNIYISPEYKCFNTVP